MEDQNEVWNTVTRYTSTSVCMSDRSRTYLQQGQIFRQSQIYQSTSSYFAVCVRLSKLCSNGRSRSSRWGVFQLKGHSTTTKSQNYETQTLVSWRTAFVSVCFVAVCDDFMQCCVSEQLNHVKWENVSIHWQKFMTIQQAPPPLLRLNQSGGSSVLQ